MKIVMCACYVMCVWTREIHKFYPAFKSPITMSCTVLQNNCFPLEKKKHSIILNFLRQCKGKQWPIPHSMSRIARVSTPEYHSYSLSHSLKCNLPRSRDLCMFVICDIWVLHGIGVSRNCWTKSCSEWEVVSPQFPLYSWCTACCTQSNNYLIEASLLFFPGF